MGARACEAAEVTVTEPAAFEAADLTAALTSVDISSLASTGDAGAMVQAALQVGVLPVPSAAQRHSAAQCHSAAQRRGQRHCLRAGCLAGNHTKPWPCR
jgi:hypothetical protein